MSLYSDAKEIKKEIIKKIEALESVQVVYPAEKINPKGFPAVFVTTAGAEGEFSSSAENSRVYEYSLLVLVPEGQDFVPPSESDRLDYAENLVGEVIDEIINAIDTDFELDGKPQDTTVLFVHAADFTMGKYQYEGGVAKAGLVTLRVYTEVTVV